ncbi:Factor arrest protein 11, partial [Diaporthe eres]
MNSLWPSRASGEANAAAPPPTTDVADTGVPDAGLTKGDQQQQAAVVHSLSLAQLRRLVADFPHAEAAAYDFEYQDTAPIEEEIDEWFVYQFWQWVRLNGVQRAFEWQWLNSHGQDTSWEEVGADARKAFVSDALSGLSSETSKDRSANVARLVYIALGRWTSTAAGSRDGEEARCVATPAQLEAIKAGVRLIADVGGVQIIFNALKKAFEPF